MTEIVASRTIPSNSKITRTHFKTYNDIDSYSSRPLQQLEQNRRVRLTKFPSLRGRHDLDSFQTNPQDPAFKVWYDRGDHHSHAPCRSYDNIIDPVSGFVSAGGDVDRNTGLDHIPQLAQINTSTQSSGPSEKNSVRVSEPAAPPELKRANTWTPGGPSAWNSRKLSDAWIKCQLGGWTSDYDPRTPAPEITRSKSMFIPKPPSEKSKELRDYLALKYMYSSSTQRAYEEVPWDHMLPEKLWAPISTLEPKADMVSQKCSLRKYEPAAQEWQSIGKSWDWFQKRRGYYKSAPISFCSPCPRTQQIPLYGGCIGAENLDEMDNVLEAFRPFTIKRVPIPSPSETGHRPNIPGYTGCTLWQGNYSPANSFSSNVAQSTTLHVHRSLPLPDASPSHKRESEMSRMVTLVPPCNPFNNIEKEEVIVS